MCCLSLQVPRPSMYVYVGRCCQHPGKESTELAKSCEWITEFSGGRHEPANTDMLEVQQMVQTTLYYI